MWIISRGYHRGDDFIAVTTNTKYSHAVLLDYDKMTVLEAIAKGVVETPLDKYLRESHRFLLVKPKHWTPEKGAAAVAKGRTAIGAGYDIGGILGLPSKKRFYCSEFVAWSWGMPMDKKGITKIIHPKHLRELGLTMLNSKKRDSIADFE